MKYNIPERVLRDISVFAKKYSINKVILFGSRARGDNTERSDIDIAVYGGNFDSFYWDIKEKVHSLLSFDGRQRQGNHGGSAGGSDGAAAHPGGRRGNQVLPSEQSKGQMEGEPRQAGAGEEARCERHEADEAGGAGGERRRRERKDDRRNLRGSGKRWSRCRSMTFYEMRRNTLKPFFASRQRKARLCPSG